MYVDWPYCVFVRTYVCMYVYEYVKAFSNYQEVLNLLIMAKDPVVADEP
jgi:hypothetical protein